MLPLWMLKYLPNMTASHIGIAHGARGPNNSIVQGDCSSLLAMIEAVTLIQRGIADVVLTGGAGDRMDITPVMYRGDSNLSHRNDSPSEASRPFDAARDGMVIGEGAATIVLEERSHAEQRGAKILGSILGYASVHAGSGFTSNNEAERHQSVQNSIERSISLALSKGSINASDVGHVNANGTSEVVPDSLEANAIRNTLADVPVTSAKSYFGNVGAASGALELAASLTQSTIPATLNYETPDPECPINVVTQAVDATSKVCLKLNQNSTGQAVSLLVHLE
jgi:3-oxoacyl-[acyl-carrier-protein] synthase II